MTRALENHVAGLLKLASEKHAHAVAIAKDRVARRRWRFWRRRPDAADLAALREAVAALDDALLLAEDAADLVTHEAMPGALAALREQRDMLAKTLEEAET